jgi:hypothetical protein
MPGWGDPKIVDTSLEHSLLEQAQQRATKSWVSRLEQEIVCFMELPPNTGIVSVWQDGDVTEVRYRHPTQGGVYSAFREGPITDLFDHLLNLG